VALEPAFGLLPQGGIELMMPLSGTMDLVPKALPGMEGTAALAERIVNPCGGLL
jgi:hypothetical protein